MILNESYFNFPQRPFCKKLICLGPQHLSISPSSVSRSLHGWIHFDLSHGTPETTTTRGLKKIYQCFSPLGKVWEQFHFTLLIISYTDHTWTVLLFYKRQSFYNKFFRSSKATRPRLNFRTVSLDSYCWKIVLLSCTIGNTEKSTNHIISCAMTYRYLKLKPNVS